MFRAQKTSDEDLRMKPAFKITTPATFLVAVLSVAVSASGGAATTVINSYASGFYQNTGATPSAGSTNIIEDSTRNNYFAFDLSGTVTGAKLTIFGGKAFSFSTARRRPR